MAYTAENIVAGSRVKRIFRHLISVNNLPIKLLNNNIMQHNVPAVTRPIISAAVTIDAVIFLSLLPETNLLTVSGSPLDTKVSITIYTENAIW